LCRYYDPAPNEGTGCGESADAIGPLGYRNVGTLLVFGHGCPNTTPRMFWKRRGRWTPLFLNRSAVPFEQLFTKASVIRFAEELKSLGDGALSRPEVLARFDDEARQTLLALSAIEHGVHQSVKIAVRTGLDVIAVDYLIQSF